MRLHELCSRWHEAAAALIFMPPWCGCDPPSWAASAISWPRRRLAGHGGGIPCCMPRSAHARRLRGCACGVLPGVRSAAWQLCWGAQRQPPVHSALPPAHTLRVHGCWCSLPCDFCLAVEARLLRNVRNTPKRAYHMPDTQVHAARAMTRLSHVPCSTNQQQVLIVTRCRGMVTLSVVGEASFDHPQFQHSLFRQAFASP